jgi:hypothetical protein
MARAHVHSYTVTWDGRMQKHCCRALHRPATWLRWRSHTLPPAWEEMRVHSVLDPVMCICEVAQVYTSHTRRARVRRQARPAHPLCTATGRRSRLSSHTHACKAYHMHCTLQDASCAFLEAGQLVGLYRSSTKREARWSSCEVAALSGSCKRVRSLLRSALPHSEKHQHTGGDVQQRSASRVCVSA